MNNRILETVRGYDAAVKEIATYVRMWNESNGEGRMVLSPGRLEAWDTEGSGEFYLAVCVNLDLAFSRNDEVYEIQTCR